MLLSKITKGTFFKHIEAFMHKLYIETSQKCSISKFSVINLQTKFLINQNHTNCNNNLNGTNDIQNRRIRITVLSK